MRSGASRLRATEPMTRRRRDPVSALSIGETNAATIESMISSVSPADTARHLRQRAASAAYLGAERARQLRLRLPAAAALLRDRYGADHVVLFGSLANGACHADSDVDLAVSGLPGDRYFKALADLMEVFAGPVDLVRLEGAPESLRERIAAEGERL
jgi:uncharacterized protein